MLAGIETVIRGGKILPTSRLGLHWVPPTLGGTMTMTAIRNHGALHSLTDHRTFLPLEAIPIALTKVVTGAQEAVAAVVQDHPTTRA